MREKPSQRIARYLKDDPLVEAVLGWSSKAPAQWETDQPGFALRQLRRRLALTQRDLAAAAGIAQGHVQRVEAGLDCRLSTLRRLLKAMGFEPILGIKSPGAGHLR